MKYPFKISKRFAVVFVTAAAIAVATGLLEFGRSRGLVTNANSSQNQVQNPTPARSSLELSPSQLNSIRIEPAGIYKFPVERETVGNISFADELSVQVFPPYQGTIIKSFAELGAQVILNDVRELEAWLKRPSARKRTRPLALSKA